jgi:hypothetical protein
MFFFTKDLKKTRNILRPLTKEHLTVDQVVEGSRPLKYAAGRPFAHPIDVGKNRRKSRQVTPQITASTPKYGGGLSMLKQTCAPFVRHFLGPQRTNDEKIANWPIK